MSRSLALRALFTALFALSLPAPAAGHELRPAALALEETAEGRFFVRLVPAANIGFEWLPEVRYPAGCRLDEDWLDCGSEGLNGEISIAGFASRESRVIARVRWLDGRDLVAVLTRDAPSLGVTSFARPGSAWTRTVTDYTKLGVEHILLGADHLAFVLGLILLVRFERRLIWTVTAFTVAHSLTLCASVLGVINVPAAPVEAVIALSILLLAVECAKPTDSLTRRLPWIVAFSFGLLHGFGFAGALREIGVPPGETPLALFSFNVGVELGQLALIGAAGALAYAASRRPALRAKLETVAVYALGTLGAHWSLERVFSIFGG
jgi:hydrogenase/urease accessory protein HupE